MSSRVLLADDSTHAQRMGERILLEEGFEVVTVTDGQTALLRLADVDPDVILADAFLPRRNGFEICEFIKRQPRYSFVRVVLTAGMLEEYPEDEGRRVGADGLLRKPFEASTMVPVMRSLAAEAQLARTAMTPEALLEIPVADQPPPEPEPQPDPEPEPAPPPVAPEAVTPEVPAVAAQPPEAERVRAAVTLALDAAMPGIIDELTQRVMIALDALGASR